MENLRKKKIVKLKPEVWLPKATLTKKNDHFGFRELVMVRDGIGYATTGKLAFIAKLSSVTKDGYYTNKWKYTTPEEYLTYIPKYPFPNFNKLEEFKYGIKPVITAYREVHFEGTLKTQKFIEIETVGWAGIKHYRYVPAKEMLNLLKGFEKKDNYTIYCKSYLDSHKTAIPVRYKSDERTAYIMFLNIKHLESQCNCNVSKKEYICELIIK